MTTNEFDKHREALNSAAHNFLIGIEKMQKLVDKAILLTKNNK